MLKSIRNAYLFWVSVLILFLLFYFVYSFEISKPFWGHHQFNGVFYGTFVQNYHRYGLIATKGAQIATSYPTESTKWALHTHHPSTYPLILFGWSKIFGVSEFSFRFLSVTATFLAFSFWLFFSQTNSRKLISSLLAMCLLLTTPLVWYYASLPVFEPLLFPLILIGLVAWDKKHFGIMFLMIFLAAILDWPGYWLGIWLLIWYGWQKDIKKMFLTGSVLALATIVIFGHQWIATGHPFAEFLKIGSHRLQITDQPFTSWQWLRLLISRTKAFLGIGVISLILLGLSVGWFTPYRKMIGLSLIIGLSHILVFRNITWYHDYMLYHLLPFLLITVSLAIKALADRFGNKFVFIVVSLWVVNLGLTWQFRSDLQAITPHKVCVDFGKQVAKTDKVLTFTGTLEETRICPPFIGFYGGKEFDLKVNE